MSIPIAVIGTGLMGADHAKIIAQDMPSATLQVVCDMDAARVRSVADALGAADISTDPNGVFLVKIRCPERCDTAGNLYLGSAVHLSTDCRSDLGDDLSADCPLSARTLELRNTQ